MRFCRSPARGACGLLSLLTWTALPAATGTVWTEKNLDGNGIVVEAAGRAADGLPVSVQVRTDGDGIRARYLHGSEVLEVARDYGRASLTLTYRCGAEAFGVRLRRVLDGEGAILDYDLPDRSRLRLGVASGPRGRMVIGDLARLRLVLASDRPVLRLARRYAGDLDELGAGAMRATSLLEPVGTNRLDGERPGPDHCLVRCARSCPSRCDVECSALGGSACDTCGAACGIGCEIACQEIRREEPPRASPRH